jgi:hypothetical protein
MAAQLADTERIQPPVHSLKDSQDKVEVDGVVSGQCKNIQESTDRGFIAQSNVCSQDSDGNLGSFEGSANPLELSS